MVVEIQILVLRNDINTPVLADTYSASQGIAMKIKHISSFVNGNFVKTNQIRPLISPVTERPYCNVEDATEDTINAAIKSSRKVFEPNSGINWANSSATAFRR